MSKFLYLALASRSLVSCVCSRDAGGVGTVLLLVPAAVGGADGAAAIASVDSAVIFVGSGVVWEASMTKLDDRSMPDADDDPEVVARISTSLLVRRTKPRLYPRPMSPVGTQRGLIGPPPPPLALFFTG